VTVAVLEATGRRLERLLAAEQARARTPTLVAGMVRDGSLCWSGVRGDVPERGGEPPSALDTQFRIGSITKTMTTVLVLQLRDEGLVSLEDRLGDHLPGAAFADRTLRELLGHSGGLPAEPPGPWWERSPGVDWDTLEGRAGALEAVLPRGRRYHYSNLAFALLGRLVAVRSGGSWWDALHGRVLAPLGMAATTYDAGPRAAQGYSVHPWSGRLVAEPHQDTGAMAAAGQLWSTVPDLARFAAFLAGDGSGVLGAESLEELAVPRSGTPDAGRTVTYGLGTRLIVTSSGRSLLGHTGSMPGFLAGLFVDRERRTAAVCLANATQGLRCEGLPTDLLEELEASEPALPEVWRPTAELPPDVEQILGLWFWGTTPLELRWDRDELCLTSPEGSTMRYRRVGADTFRGSTGYHTGETLRVVRRGDRASHLECATFVYTRSPYDPDAPIPGGHPDL
jgi:CubicO group peptidase (beta-lactamase class C family)